MVAHAYRAFRAGFPWIAARSWGGSAVCILPCDPAVLHLDCDHSLANTTDIGGGQNLILRV